MAAIAYVACFAGGLIYSWRQKTGWDLGHKLEATTNGGFGWARADLDLSGIKNMVHPSPQASVPLRSCFCWRTSWERNLEQPSHLGFRNWSVSLRAFQPVQGVARVPEKAFNINEEVPKLNYGEGRCLCDHTVSKAIFGRWKVLWQFPLWLIL